MTFAAQNFTRRYLKMGDEAEAKFLEVAGNLYGIDKSGSPRATKVGLSRPTMDVRKLPTRIRHLPDFVTERSLVECQGIGRDQILKLKREKMDCLSFWNVIFPVELFVWDSYRKRYSITPLEDLNKMIDKGLATVGYFHEGKAVWQIDAEHLEWIK